MIPAHSSGSRVSWRSIEPLTSAKSTVSCLRSACPSVGAGGAAAAAEAAAACAIAAHPGTGGGGGGGCTAGGAWLDAAAATAMGPDRGLPHSPQKRWPSSVGAPHAGQATARRVPQLVQNLRPSGLSTPHVGQGRL